MEKILNILDYKIRENSISDILIAIVIFLLIFLILKFLIKFLNKKIKKIKNDEELGLKVILPNIIKDTPKYFFLILAIYFPIKSLNLPNNFNQIINIIFIIAVIIQIIRIANTLLRYLLEKTFKQNGEIETGTQTIIKIVVKVIVWIIGILLILTNLWVEITPIIASLWLWWIAVAFSLQHILEDVFSSISIIFSKPFKVGDWVTTETYSWTVNKITLKSTRITSIEGHEIIVPNKEIANNSINNYGEMRYRRKKFTIDIVYETSVEKLKSIEGIIKKIIEKQEGVTFEWVRLKKLWAYSIIFEISYKLDNPDFQEYLDTHHRIVFELLETFEKEKILIAYPTQVVYTPDVKSK